MSATEEYMAEAFRCLRKAESFEAGIQASQVYAQVGVGYALLAQVQQGQARPAPAPYATGAIPDAEALARLRHVTSTQDVQKGERDTPAPDGEFL